MKANLRSWLTILGAFACVWVAFPVNGKQAISISNSHRHGNVQIVAAGPDPTPSSYESAQPSPITSALVVTDTFDSDTVGVLPSGWNYYSGMGGWAVSTLNDNTSPNALGEGWVTAKAGDPAWYNLAYAQVLREQFSYRAIGTVAQFYPVIQSHGLSGYYAVDLNAGKVYAEPEPPSTASPVPYCCLTGGNIPSLTVGHTYGVRVKMSGDEISLAQWDISAGQTPSPYGTPVAIPTFAASTGGFANISGSQFSIDDLSLVYISDVFPALSTPVPSPTPTVGTTYSPHVVGAAAAASTTGTVTLPTMGTPLPSMTPGDILVAEISAKPSATFSPPANWLSAGSVSNSGLTSALYYYLVGSTLPTSIEFTSTQAGVSACLVDVRNATTSGFGLSGVTSNSAALPSASIWTDSYVSPTAGALPLAFISGVQNTSSITFANNSYSAIANGSIAVSGYACTVGTVGAGNQTTDNFSSLTTSATLSQSTPSPAVAYQVVLTAAFPYAGWVAFPPGKSPSGSTNGPPLQASIASVYGPNPYSSTVPCPIATYALISQTYGCLLTKSSNTIKNVFKAVTGYPQGTGQGFFDDDYGSQTYFTNLVLNACPYYLACPSPPPVPNPYPTGKLSSGNQFPLYTSTSSDPTVTILNGGCEYGLNVNLPSPVAVHYKSGWVPQTGPDRHIFARDYSLGSWGREITTILSGLLTTSNINLNSYGGTGYWPIGILDAGHITASYQCPVTSPPPSDYVGVALSTASPAAPVGAVRLLYPTATGTPGPGTVPGAASITTVSSANGTGLSGTAGGLSAFGGVIRPQEVMADDGTADMSGINHALIINETCDTTGPNRILNPATGNDGGGPTTAPTTSPIPNICFDSSQNIDYGGHFAINQAPTNTGIYTTGPSGNMIPCDQFSHAYLKAFYYFGGYMNDIGNLGNSTSSDTGFTVLVAPDIDDTLNGGTSVWAAVIAAMYTQGVIAGDWYRPGDATPSPNSRITFSVPDGACGIWTGQNDDGNPSNWVYLKPPY